jgi:response regulator of citrate/malate metabolism
MRHQRNLKKTKMLIGVLDYFIHTFKDSPLEYKIDDYEELLDELKEEEAQLERTIERKS